MNTSRLAIEESPDDWPAYLVYADFLEESGCMEFSLVVRWMAANRRRPHRLNRDGGGYPWMWTCEDGIREALPHAALPRSLCTAMDFWEWRCYGTWLEAAESLQKGLEVKVGEKE